MKVWIIISLNLILVSNLYGQKDTSFFFNEFSISINYTTLRDDNTENRFGFGLGLYRSFIKKEKTKPFFVFGFEYNNTRQFKKSMYGGHYNSYSNVLYDLNYISIPTLLRVNLPRTSKFFIEPGFFFEFLIGSNQSGLSSLNFGPSFGIGLKTPIFESHYLIIKMDYKIGLKYLYESMDNIQNRYVRFMIAFKF